MRKPVLLLTAILAAILVRSASAEPPRRIVSFRPNVTEILFALGLGNRVVGVTDFCRLPEDQPRRGVEGEAPAALPTEGATRAPEKIGGYFNRRLEKVLSLRPDLVVLVPDATTAKIASALERSKIPILTLKADTIEDVYDSIARIAEAGGVPERGRSLIADIRSRMEEKSRAVKSLAPKKTLLVIQRRPLITAGGGTFLDRLLVLAGGENVAGSSDLPYPQYNMESVVARAPEVILDFDTSDPSAPESFWARYPSIPAVRRGAVRRLSPDLFIPGPRLPEALDLLIQTLHNVGP